MRRFRFRIGTILILIVALGVGFAALRESNDAWDSGIFSLTLGALLVSILFAIHRSEKKRAFWVGFAFFGAAYLGLTLIPAIESRFITTKALAFLHSRLPRSMPAYFEYFDYDNDGDVDIYVANQPQPNALNVGKGNGTFQDVTTVAGLTPAGNQVGGNGRLFFHSAVLWQRGSSGTSGNFIRIGCNRAGAIDYAAFEAFSLTVLD
jgi:hypothetical protein